MKKILALLMLVLFSLSMSACFLNTDSGDSPSTEQGDESGFDYLTSDLSEYLSIDDAWIDSFIATVCVPRPTELNVNERIMQALYQNRKPLEGDPVYQENLTISAGDEVKLYYRGFLYGEDGSKNYFDGGCNFSSSNPSALGIGSGKLISGFEYGLVGKNQKDYATLEIITRDSENCYDPLQSDDIVVIAYSIPNEEGYLRYERAIIDLADPNLAAKWGEEFSTYWKENYTFVGNSFSVALDTESAAYTAKIIVEEVYRITDDKPTLLIESYFPHDYHIHGLDLKGKTAYFEIFIVSAVDYEVHDFNDAFVSDILGYSQDSLSQYEGDTLTEKYTAKIKDELEKKYQADIDEYVEEQLFAYLFETAEYKKLPTQEVNNAYEDMCAEIEMDYKRYMDKPDPQPSGDGYMALPMYNPFARVHSRYFKSYALSDIFWITTSDSPTLDEFATAYLGLSAGDDWRGFVLSAAEDNVKHRMIFYYVIREMDLLPPNTEYQSLLEEEKDKLLEKQLAYHRIKESNADYTEKYNEQKNFVMENYPDLYWQDAVCYNYAIEKLCHKVNVVNSAL